MPPMSTFLMLLDFFSKIQIRLISYSQLLLEWNCHFISQIQLYILAFFCISVLESYSSKCIWIVFQIIFIVIWITFEE